MRLRLVFISLLAVIAAQASAQVTFTLTATANASSLGYEAGQSYVFTLTTGTSFGLNTSSNFDSSQNFWAEELLSEPALFASVTGSGLTGTLTRPSAGELDPYSYIETYPGWSDGQDALWLRAGADLSSIGLFTNGGASPCRRSR